MIRTLPVYEGYDMIDRVQRAAMSITENMVEDFGKHHPNENAQFCRISRGFLYKLIDDLITAKDE